MERNEVLSALAAARPLLAELHIAELWLFGSVARGEAGADSDVDLLVRFDHSVGLLHFIRARNALAEILGTGVDLVTRDALHPRLRDRILNEACRAA